MREALRIAECLKKKRQRSKATLTIRWTAGHEGLEGNELADEEAKEAAKGHTSETKLLPSYLRKPLLIIHQQSKQLTIQCLRKNGKLDGESPSKGKR